MTEVTELQLENERTRILKEFIENTQHEFRTSLSLIKTSTHLIRKGADPQKRLDQIDNIVGEITALIDKMLEIIQLDHGETSQTALVNVNVVVREIANELGSMATKKQQALHMTLDQHCSPIRGDEILIYKAIQCIVQNAVSYTPECGAIHLTTSQQHGEVIIEITDTGMGMDSTIHELIFERFYRADIAHTTRGFGLGLPIARSIIAKHGGTIRVESSVGNGSTFKIALPAAQPTRKEQSHTA